jgi:hypothetical protein
MCEINSFAIVYFFFDDRLFKQPYLKKNYWDVLIWVTGHCNRAAVSRNRYGVEKTVDTHKILINAINIYVCLQEIW